MEFSYILPGLALVAFFGVLYIRVRKAKKSKPATGGSPYTPPPKNPNEREHLK